MFTGLIEAVGVVASLSTAAGGDARLLLATGLGPQLAAGESVAVDGCCLTVVEPTPEGFAADLSPATRARTSLGDWRPGRRVNLERAVAAGGRFGGHLVQGHVDGVVRWLSVAAEGEGARHRLQLAEADAAFVVPQGSVAVDGVSLTVAALGPGWFEVALVPATLASTTLGERRPGASGNVEFDLVGKHVLRALAVAGRVDLPPATRARLGLVE